MKYGAQYDNTQDLSQIFQTHMSSLASKLIHEKNVKNSHIVEVGCGKGSFLRKLVEEEKLGNVGYGFDPSYTGPDTDLSGRINFQKRYYDSDCSNLHTDIVVCRHVIEHVPQPTTLLRTIRKSLVNSPKARVFFETPAVDWILKNQVIWDFFYEHCSYFSINSLVTTFEEAQYKIENTEYLFNGQYMLIEAIPTNTKAPSTKNLRNIEELASVYAESESKNIAQWKKRIEELQNKGKVAIWGAGAKGVTFANLVDPDCQLIDCIIDINPKKQGKFIPGTGHPIVGYEKIKDRNVSSVVLMNPNYYEENNDLLKKEGISINFVQ